MSIDFAIKFQTNALSLKLKYFITLIFPMYEIHTHTHSTLLEQEMATHSSNLAWKIPWTEEPGRLHTVHGVAKRRHDLAA